MSISSEHFKKLFRPIAWASKKDNVVAAKKRHPDTRVYKIPCYSADSLEIAIDNVITDLQSLFDSNGVTDWDEVPMIYLSEAIDVLEELRESIYGR
jgi:hypothetical protein